MNDRESSTSMLGIGDFARAAGLSVSAVRFYGDRGLLVPDDVDPSSGYRSYSPEQVGTACLIRDLRKLGMSLAAITSAIELPPEELSATVTALVAQLETDVAHARELASDLTDSDPVSASSDHAPTTIDAAELCTAFEQVLPLASSDFELPHLMTIRIESLGGSVRIVATDTHRLAVRDLVPVTVGEDFVALVATATIRRLLPQIARLDQVHLRLNDKSLSIEADEATLTATVIPADYPDYEPFLAQPASATAVLVDRTTLRDALDAFDEDGAVLMSVTAERVAIERRDQHVEIPAKSIGPDVHVAINPHFAIDSIDGAIAAEVVIEIEEDPLRPVVFRSATDGTYVSVLMPVQLASARLGE